MSETRPSNDHPALSVVLGHWRGSTHLAAGPWGPERIVEAEVTYRRVAGGFGVVQTYRHFEADGTHFEGYGIFTVDPDHQDVFWYYVDSHGGAPEGRSRCTWHDGVLRVERHGRGGWTRHAIRVEGDVLTHVTELRSRDVDLDHPGGGARAGADANGTGSAYTPFMTSTFRRT